MNKLLPQYPIYIVSKGRWESRLTSKALEKMKLFYYIVVEPQEYKKYSKVIDPRKILKLPFSNLNQGSIPARNWIWEHSLDNKNERHWILDDNILGFMRHNNNMPIKVITPAIFRAAEDFINRYENISLAGFNYDYLFPRKEKRPPFYKNTRIYSCILIKNNLPFRWRGKYNEDTDLSLRVLKKGDCTILFNAFLAQKVTTMIMKGGNTDNVYIDNDNRYLFAKSLQKQHSDVVKVVWRYNRWHHGVNYNIFKKNKLVKKKGIIIPEKINNYGMILKKGK